DRRNAAARGTPERDDRSTRAAQRRTRVRDRRDAPARAWWARGAWRRSRTRRQRIWSLQLQERGVAVGERAHQLLEEVVGALADGGGHALFVQRARVRNLAAEAHGQVTVATAGDDLGLVIQLDLRDEQLRVPSRGRGRLLRVGGAAGGRAPFGADVRWRVSV